MNFFDDLRTRVEQSVNATVQDFNSYVQNQIVDPIVKVGKAATGNLSEAEIQAGKTASPPAVAPPQYIPTTAAAGLSVVSILAIGAIAYLLLSKKSRG